MTRATTDGLLLELLNQQVDAGDGAGLSETRIRQALTIGPGFTEAEGRLIWRSPFARDSVLRVKDDLCREVLAHWHESGIDPVADFKAAAGGSEDVVRLQGKGFTLTIFPQSDETMPWILSLQIDPALRERFPTGLKFQLVDSGGMVWLTGRPNSRGEINDGWYDTTTAPKDRLLAHYLRLTPV